MENDGCEDILDVSSCRETRRYSASTTVCLSRKRVCLLTPASVSRGGDASRPVNRSTEEACVLSVFLSAPSLLAGKRACPVDKELQ